MRGSNKYSSDTLSLDIKLSSSVSLGLADEQVVASTYTSSRQPTAPTWTSNWTSISTRASTLPSRRKQTTQNPAAGGRTFHTTRTRRLRMGDSSALLAHDPDGLLAGEFRRHQRKDRQEKDRYQRRVGRLAQSDFAPTLTFTLYGLVTLNFGDSQYSYDKDLSTFSANISRFVEYDQHRERGPQRSDKDQLRSFPSLLYGFPERIYSAGVSGTAFGQLDQALHQEAEQHSRCGSLGHRRGCRADPRTYPNGRANNLGISVPRAGRWTRSVLLFLRTEFAAQRWRLLLKVCW